MVGFSDSAIFYRLWDLMGGVRDPLVASHLTEGEKEALAEFMTVFDSLAWEPVSSHPHVSEIPGDDLSPLLPAGRRLHDLVRRRSRVPLLRRLRLRLQGWPW
jgi:hypothetical protein